MRLPPRVWKFLRSRRVWWAVALLPFVLGVLGAGYFGMVNWMGERALAEHREWLVANGYTLTVRDHFPPAANPDADVLQHPAMVAEMAATDRLDGLHRGSARNRLPGLAKHRPSVDAERGELQDVRTWFDPPRHATDAEAAKEILAALTPERQRMGRVVEALQRPQCGWQLKTNENSYISVAGQLAMFGPARFASEVAVLQLVAGDAEAAALLLEAELALVAHQYRGPSLMSCDMAGAFLQQAQPVLQEGIARQAWSEAMLARFAAQLAALAPQAAFVDCLRGEVSFGMHALPMTLQRPELNLLDGWEPDREAVAARLREIWQTVRPVGAIKQEFIAAQQQLVAETDMSMGVPRIRFSREESMRFAGRQDEVEERSRLEQKVWMTLQYVAEGALESEAVIALSRTGIALERYRLKHAVHPQELAALVPEFLPAVPMDPYDLRPLRYRLLPDGSPLVWSVDLDSDDNAGTRPKQRRSFRREPGYDRIWVTRPLPPAP